VNLQRKVHDRNQTEYLDWVFSLEIFSLTLGVSLDKDDCPWDVTYKDDQMWREIN
jgi:hypothetical protein